jgi:two-component system, NarL family, sensor histidine kinase UhpB
VTAELTIEKDTLLRILDQMPEAMYIVNSLYEIEYANAAMEREFGKVGHQKCYEYTCGPGAGICPSCRNPEIFDGKSISTEWTSPRSNKVYDCYEAPIVIRNGVLGKLKILHDITAFKNAGWELASRHRQIQRLSSELLSVQETERLRISKELHDELGQALTLIKLKIGLIEANMPEAIPLVKKYCEEAAAHVDEAIENMRRLSRDLSPVTVETLGITIALRRLAEEFDRLGGIRVAADISPIDDLLPLHSCILLYRIFQEGLNNIVKHSGASLARLSVRRGDDAIHFELKDNGKGIDISKEDQKKTGSGGFGLAIMTERVRTLGGSLEIDSRRDAGTTLRFIIPGKKSGDSLDNPPDNRIALS